MASQSRRTVAVPLVVTVVVGLSALSVAMAADLGTSPAGFLAGNQASQWLGGLCVGLTGAAVLRFTDNRLGPVLATLGVLNALAGAAQEYAVLAHREALPGAVLAAWCATFCWIPGLVGTLLALALLFPDGRLGSRRWRMPAYAASAATGLATLLACTTQQPLDEGGFGWAHNPLNLPTPDSDQLAVGMALVGVAVVIGLVATVRAVVRLPRLHGPERIRTALFAIAVLLLLTGLAIPSVVVSFGLTVLGFALLTAAIVRYRLFDIEAYLPRAAAYALCAAATMGAYLLTATAVATRPERGGYLAAFVTAVVALVVARIVERLNRLIGRLLFGDRDRPHEALVALGARLAGALDPDEILPSAVARIRQSLRLPYAEIRLAGTDAYAVAAGNRPSHTSTFRLEHAGDDVGVLIVGLRAGERSLAAADARVLTSFAHQVAVAAHGVKATRDLRRSREQVVLAREAERRRLHRDLHDGVGPALAGISLGLESAGRMVTRDPQAAVRLIAGLRNETSHCVDDIRRAITDLRPPAIDDAGLVGALRQQGQALVAQTEGRLAVTVVGSTAGHVLPPAVEVAAYRIACEALTNAARHSGAARVRVDLHCDTHLRLQVCDDGNGAAPAQAGTGLTSMRERAEELGGTCMVHFQKGTGTTVSACLPLLGEAR